MPFQAAGVSTVQVAPSASVPVEVVTGTRGPGTAAGAHDTAVATPSPSTAVPARIRCSVFTAHRSGLRAGEAGQVVGAAPGLGDPPVDDAVDEDRREHLPDTAAGHAEEALLLAAVGAADDDSVARRDHVVDRPGRDEGRFDVAEQLVDAGAARREAGWSAVHGPVVGDEGAQPFEVVVGDAVEELDADSARVMPVRCRSGRVRRAAAATTIPVGGCPGAVVVQAYRCARKSSTARTRRW